MSGIAYTIHTDECNLPVSWDSLLLPGLQKLVREELEGLFQEAFVDSVVEQHISLFGSGKFQVWVRTSLPWKVTEKRLESFNHKKIQKMALAGSNGEHNVEFYFSISEAPRDAR